MLLLKNAGAIYRCTNLPTSLYMYVYIHKMLLLVLTTVGQNTQDTRCNTNTTTIVSMLTYSRRRTAYVTTACTIYTYVWASRLLHPWTCTDVWWSARRQQKKENGRSAQFYWNVRWFRVYINITGRSGAGRSTAGANPRIKNCPLCFYVLLWPAKAVQRKQNRLSNLPLGTPSLLTANAAGSKMSLKPYRKKK